MNNDANENADKRVDAFLTQTGWSGAQLSPLSGDASSRRYMRVILSGRRAILMIAPPEAEAAACPAGADKAAREALGYNAVARLAGPNLAAFVAVADGLREAGLSAPEVYAVDFDQGFALIEDLGDGLFARIIGAVREKTLYAAAVDALLFAHKNQVRPAANPRYNLFEYDEAALLVETGLLLEWYWPLKSGAPAAGDVRAEYDDLFSELISRISPPDVFVLRDYHAENLLWLPERSGPARVGLIDFQDGLLGSRAYDLLSMLEDARRDVDPSLAESMIDYYCAGARETGGFDERQFKTDYAVLAAQRNAKILGIFARLANRDGKTRYLDLLPRVEAHFRRDLARPGMSALRAFCDRHLPDLAP